MILLWILAAIAIIILLRYAYLIIKRIILIRKISKGLKAQNGRMQRCRNPLISVFKPDGKVDMTISCQEKSIDVSIITTPLRRVRYHFDNNKTLELFVERRSAYKANSKVAKPAIVIYDTSYRIWKYRFELTPSECGKEKYVILNPAPISTSMACGPTLVTLYNGDVLANEVKVCGLKWFVENIID